MARMRKTKASNRQKAKTAKKAQIDRRAAYNQDRARSGQLKNKRGNIATGGESTGRESGIIASQQKSRVNKIKGLEQSVGSLDRRIQNALDNKDTDTAKDLRSRLNKFTDKLGYERAILHDGVMRNKDGRILRSTSGNPMMNTRGREVFDETKDQDFIDPTRKLQNTGGDAYGKMYPISNYLQKGPMWVQGLKSLFDKGKKRNIPYNLDDMPGVRYPLDEGWGRGEFFGGRSRDPNYKQPFFSWPDTDVSISDMVVANEDDDQEGAFKYDPVPYIHPAIDPNKRSEIMDEGYGDIIESGRQDYETLFSEWEKNNLNQADLLDKFGDPMDPVKLQELKDALDAEQNARENPMVPIDQSEFNPENIDYTQITETLKGPEYNLKDDQIEALLNYKPDLLNSSDINSTLADFYSQ